MLTDHSRQLKGPFEGIIARGRQGCSDNLADWIHAPNLILCSKMNVDQRAALETVGEMAPYCWTSGKETHLPTLSKNDLNSIRTRQPFLNWGKGFHLQFQNWAKCYFPDIRPSEWFTHRNCLWGRSLLGAVSRNPLNYLFSKLTTSQVHLHVSTITLQVYEDSATINDNATNMLLWPFCRYSFQHILKT